MAFQKSTDLTDRNGCIDSESRIDSFVYEHELHNPIKEKTCFKSDHNSSCIDLVLTNNAMAFQNTTTVFTGISDFHKLVLIVLKTSITKKVSLKKLLTETLKILILLDLMMS